MFETLRWISEEVRKMTERVRSLFAEFERGVKKIERKEKEFEGGWKKFERKYPLMKILTLPLFRSPLSLSIDFNNQKNK